MDYWLSEEAKAAFGDSFYWIVNCQASGKGMLSLGAASGVSAADIPFGPKKLSVQHQFDGPGELGAIFSLEGVATNWRLTEAGTVDITEFNQEHIVGTFTLEYEDALATADGRDPVNITVSGEFDYENPN